MVLHVPVYQRDVKDNKNPNTYNSWIKQSSHNTVVKKLKG